MEDTKKEDHLNQHEQSKYEIMETEGACISPHHVLCAYIMASCLVFGEHSECANEWDFSAFSWALFLLLAFIVQHECVSFGILLYYYLLYLLFIIFIIINEI